MEVGGCRNGDLLCRHCGWLLSVDGETAGGGCKASEDVVSQEEMANALTLPFFTRIFLCRLFSAKKAHAEMPVQHAASSCSPSQTILKNQQGVTTLDTADSEAFKNQLHWTIEAYSRDACPTSTESQTQHETRHKRRPRLEVSHQKVGRPVPDPLQRATPIAPHTSRLWTRCTAYELIIPRVDRGPVDADQSLTVHILQ